MFAAPALSVIAGGTLRGSRANVQSERGCQRAHAAPPVRFRVLAHEDLVTGIRANRAE